MSEVRDSLPPPPRMGAVERPGSRIMGVGHYVPERVLTNLDL